MKFSSEEGIARFKIAIVKLYRKGTIERCNPCKNQFLPSYFLIPKADGSDRFIFNLEESNEFIDNSQFKIEDIRTASRLLFPGFFMATIDLEDAYFLIPIDESS